MNENKNIDRLFQEKFKDFEATPQDAVWDRISESLPKKKKKRRVIALWWQIGGVAAVIALMLTVGSSIFNNDPEISTDTEVVDHKDTNESTIEDTTNPSNTNQDPIKTNADGHELVGSDNTTEDNDAVATEKRRLNTNDAFKNQDPKTNAIANRSKIDEKRSLTETAHNPKTISNKNADAKVADNTSLEDTQTKATILDNPTAKSVIKETIKNDNTAVTDGNSIPETNQQNSKVVNADTDLEKEKETALQEDPNKESIETAIAAQQHMDEKEKEDEQNRWSIAPNVAPVYFSSLGQGSSIDAQFNENSKSGDINMSYGITGTYAVSKRLKIRAGVNRVNLNQTTADVLAFAGGDFASRGVEGGEQSQMGNITPKTELGNITFMSANVFNSSTSPELFNTKTPGNIDQRFGFIEVPLELEYRLVDRKFGLNVIGGFSTFFLNQNEIYADIDGTSTLVGEASNINSTSFSANFGLGLDYSLSKQWNINLEPQFKYQINTFNNTSGNFRPFFIGVYTGLSFKF
ncbi:hypothetical protein [Winogradskyella sp.]|uniref:hypothetical protein n=1 Tax=Winogradskyella sp. TaxID=1883156 RepID=UPI003BAA0DE3